MTKPSPAEVLSEVLEQLEALQIEIEVEQLQLNREVSYDLRPLRRYDGKMGITPEVRGLEALVDLGIVLWKVRDLAEQLSEPVKVRLRKEAEEVLVEHEPGPVDVKGTNGSRAIVVVQGEGPKRRKGFSLARAQRILGSPFKDFFETVPESFKPTKDFMVQAEDADAETLTKLSKLVDLKALQTRVTFKSRGMK